MELLLKLNQPLRSKVDVLEEHPPTGGREGGEGGKDNVRSSKG